MQPHKSKKDAEMDRIIGIMFIIYLNNSTDFFMNSLGTAHITCMESWWGSFIGKTVWFLIHNHAPIHTSNQLHLCNSETLQVVLSHTSFSVLSIYILIFIWFQYVTLRLHYCLWHPICSLIDKLPGEMVSGIHFALFFAFCRNDTLLNTLQAI